MESELDIAIKNLKKNLDVESKEEIDEVSFKKDIYYALRESIKNKKEVLVIGNYAIKLVIILIDLILKEILKLNTLF